MHSNKKAELTKCKTNKQRPHDIRLLSRDIHKQNVSGINFPLTTKSLQISTPHKMKKVKLNKKRHFSSNKYEPQKHDTKKRSIHREKVITIFK